MANGSNALVSPSVRNALATRQRNALGPQVPRSLPDPNAPIAPTQAPLPDPLGARALGRGINFLIGPHAAAGLERITEFLPGPTDIRDIVGGVQETARGVVTGDPQQAAQGVGETGLGVLGALPGGDVASAALKGILAGPMAARRLGREGSEASEMLVEAGVSPDKVFEASGWYRGPDGIMRFEIPDRDVTFTPFAEDMFARAQRDIAAGRIPQFQKGVKPLRLDDALNHPRMFDAYPELRNVKIIFSSLGQGSGNVRGFFDPMEKLIVINAERIKNIDDARSTIFHEAQHAVQEIEDFARGGSPEFMQTLLSRDKSAPELAKDRRALMKAYRALAGETEARVVGERAVAPSARQPVPFRQEDFPRSEQIVLRPSGIQAGAAPFSGDFGVGGP